MATLDRLYIEEIDCDDGSIVMLAAIATPVGVTPPSVKSWIIRNLTPAACDMLHDSLDAAFERGDTEPTLDAWTAMQAES